MRSSLPQLASHLPGRLDYLRAPSLAFLELSSISRGLFVTDVVLKKAPVKFLTSQAISAGKHILLFFGDVASVEESYLAALSEAAGTLVKNIFIPGVHSGLAPFLNCLWDDGTVAQTPGVDDALGIVESLSLSGAILAADRSLKAADVALCRMKLGKGIGGKAYYVVCGKLGEVQASVQEAESCLTELGSLARVDLIPRPQEELMEHL